MNEVGRTAGSPQADARRGRLWLPLLQRLTALSPSMVVWKNASSALQGHGDLDVVAPPSDWSRIELDFRQWARAEGLRPVAVCRHIPGSMFLLAVDPEPPAFFELDIKARGSFRGATVFRSRDLQALAEMDPQGFRRLRPGAEGVLKLLLNCTTRDGSLDHSRLHRERVVELVREDPSGAEQAARLFGSAGEQVVELVAELLQGEWNRGSMLALQSHLRLRLVFEPATVVQRLWLQIRPGRKCNGIKSLIKAGHLAPGDAPGLQQAVRAHSASRGMVSP